MTSGRRLGPWSPSLRVEGDTYNPRGPSEGDMPCLKDSPV